MESNIEEIVGKTIESVSHTETGDEYSDFHEIYLNFDDNTSIRIRSADIECYHVSWIIVEPLKKATQ